MKASIVTVGDELLIGQVVDTNSAWIGSQLVERGIEVKLKIAVPDQLEDIQNGLATACSISDLVLITGGLGPTKDDVTKKALADYFKCELVFSAPTYARIEHLFHKRGIPISPAHRAQCYMPVMAELLENQMGTAPGMWFENGGKIVISMPGVPHEMKYIMTNGVLPRIDNQSKQFYSQRTIRTAGIGESSLADLIEPILEQHPVKLAYLPSTGQVRLRLSKEGKDPMTVQREVDNAVDAVKNTIGRHIYGYDQDLLEEHIGQLLLESDKTLATAESCTGGYLAHLITSIPGSSRYYQGSMITYSNRAKELLLDVPQELLNTYGAVSGETVQAMVKGALSKIPCDVAIAISGIAGPDGGTPDKPVGTVWIAVGDHKNIKSKQYLFAKDRLLNIKYTAVYALIMLRNFLLAR